MFRSQVRPLPEAVLEARRTMPLDDGHIKDPRVVPPSRQAAYLKAWGEWMRANPLYREPWMLDLLAEMKARRK